MHTTQGKPETLEAILPSGGIPDTSAPGRRPNNWTKHVYAKSEVARYQWSNGVYVERMLVHLYRCEVTGALRVWGCESVPNGWAKESN